jgi:hypothetical protein
MGCRTRRRAAPAQHELSVLLKYRQGVTRQIHPEILRDPPTLTTNRSRTLSTLSYLSLLYRCRHSFLSDTLTGPVADDDARSSTEFLDRFERFRERLALAAQKDHGA